MSGLETGPRSGFLWGKAVGTGGRQAGRRGRKWSKVGQDRRRNRGQTSLAREWVKLSLASDVDESRQTPWFLPLSCGDSNRKACTQWYVQNLGTVLPNKKKRIISVPRFPNRMSRRAARGRASTNLAIALGHEPNVTPTPTCMKPRPMCESATEEGPLALAPKPGSGWLGGPWCGKRTPCEDELSRTSPGIDDGKEQSQTRPDSQTWENKESRFGRGND
ncbi:hypothetical protein B0H65DRAFT_170308 [Neurospora tetraspora]|uniref:Uncharacterized protein n=1 Tax=Neurospora tetraspora TaxID=94610 RepID=A0AAE0MTU4_9PEZI|nr:hypothetical protein B0H65DRAFT_170308 [Neurospora tetraspora]